MTRVILGGGLSGLSAAFYLLKRLPKQPIFLIESSNRLGGWIKSDPVQDNIILEQAARTLRPRGELGENTLALIEELGLSNAVIPISMSSPPAKNRMIYVKGNLISLPSSISDLFVVKPPLTKPLINHLLNDIKIPAKFVKDESIYDFVQRRFGTEIADYFISPMICGICAGNAKEISVNFLFKTLFDYEQNHGGVIKGFIKSIFAKKEKNTITSDLATKAKQEMWSIYSLSGGLETLTKSLSDHISAKNVNTMLNSTCQELKLYSKGVDVILNDGNHINTPHVISALPSYSLAKLVKNQHPELASLLNEIKFVTVCVVNLVYNKKWIKKDGFGFLVPPIENLPILGVIYDSCCFPYGNDKTVLTVMMGGHWFNKYFGKSATEEELLAVATEQLKNIMGIDEEPTLSKVNILKNCIPQYVVGHNETVAKINDYISSKFLPISLCGSSYEGVGVNDVILSAKKAVDHVK